MDDTLGRELERERVTLETRRSELEQEIARLESEKEGVSFKLGHVIALLKGTEVEGVEADRHISAQVIKETGELTDPTEIARLILEEHGTDPIYYRKLADLVKERGGGLEGADPAMTLVSRLVADDRFVRPFRRGWYALRVHYPKVKSVGQRKKYRSMRSRTPNSKIGHKGGK